MNTNSRSLLALTLGVLPLTGQQPSAALSASPHEPVRSDRAAASSAEEWRLPVHADRDEPDVWWASGATFKVRFDDGMTFFPVLGASAPHNLPLRWRSLGIELEGQASVIGPAGAAVPRTREWRFELVRPGCVERYDVTPAGVEQSFVVDRPVLGAITGDLVVRGALETPLACTVRGPAHGPLSFADANGREVLVYGAAFAVDAAQRRLPITTALCDGIVELRVPADWLRDAAWPVVVDPLTQRSSITTSSGEESAYPSLAHDFGRNRHLVGDTRAVSASDHDLRAVLRDANWSQVATIFSDLTAADTLHSALSYTAAPSRWLLAYERRTAASSRIRLYFHDTSSAGLHTGVETEVFAPAGIHDSKPSLGSQSGSFAYLAFQRDVAPVPIDTDHTYPIGCRVDMYGSSYGPLVALHTNPGSNYDVDHVCVSRLAGWLWMVVWQEYNFDNASDDWDIIAHAVGFDGQPFDYLVLGESGSEDLHKLTPCVDGWDEEWLVGYVTRSNLGLKNVAGQGNAVRVQRFRWDGANLVTVGGSRTVDSTGSAYLVLGQTNRAVEISTGTESHWAIAWHRIHTRELLAARIGFDGYTAEKVVVEPAPATGVARSPSLAWDWNSYSFALVYATSGVSGLEPLYGRHFEFDLRAQSTVYGVGCSGMISASTGGTTDQPFAGTRDYRIGLLNARPSLPTVLLAAAAPADVPLPGGCRLLVDPAAQALSVWTTVTSGGGSAALELAIPSHLRGASVYWQFAQFGQSVLTTSNGLHTLIH